MLKDRVGRYVSKMDKIQYYRLDSILVAKLFVWGTRHSYSITLYY